MNTILICLVAAICTAQIADVRGDNLNVLKAQLDKAKGDVNRVINDLTRSKNKLRDDLNNRLYNIQFNAMQSINNIVNPGMTEIRNGVNSAKEAGKDADHCLEPGRLALRDISQNAFSAITACRTNGVETVVPVQNNMDAAIAVGNQLLAELNSIFLNCYSSNIFQMQSCIAIAIGKSNLAIRNLQTTVDTVKSSGNSVSNNGYIQGSSCMNDVVSSTRPKISPVVTSAKDCISKA